MYNAAVEMMDGGNHLLNPKFAEVKPVCAKAAGGHRCKKKNVHPNLASYMSVLVQNRN